MKERKEEWRMIERREGEDFGRIKVVDDRETEERGRREAGEL